MILKNSKEYDSILHITADIAFIDQLFATHFNNLDQAKLQLEELYGSEYKDHWQNSSTGLEKRLASVLYERNRSLIERAYCFYRIEQMEQVYHDVPTLSIEDTIDKVELQYSLAENDLRIEERNIALLRMAKTFPGKTIWGVEIGQKVWAYHAELQRRMLQQQLVRKKLENQLNTSLAQREKTYSCTPMTPREIDNPFSFLKKCSNR